MTEIGLCLPQLGPHVTRACLRAFCERAESLGFGSLWVQEHLFYPVDPPSGYHRPGVPVPYQYHSVFAATELLAAAAAWTERVMLGTSVLVAGYHRPIELAQRLATLDQLSGGRLVAGFSVGWSDEEHEQMDVDPRTRGARAAELIQAIEACWGPDPVLYSGRFFNIPLSRVNPKPVQSPRPRLLSGMASRSGLDRTVRQFDIWNPGGSPRFARVQIDELNVRRPPDQPLALYLRTFLEPPSGQSNEPPLGVEGVRMVAEEAMNCNVDTLIVDANFWSAIDSPDAWASVPDQLAELPAIASLGRGGRVNRR